MASLKHIKERINSVTSTQKITSAMKMISASKLARAQRAISNMLPYSNALNHVLSNLFASESENVVFDSALTVRREPKRVAIIAFSSDSSLAGAFNANVIRETRNLLQSYSHLPKSDVELYTIGKKVNDAISKLKYEKHENFPELASKPNYEVIAELAGRIIERFQAGELDRVEVVYHHFKSAGSQVLTNEEFLPLTLPEAEDKKPSTDYIFEPSREDIINSLLPKALRLQLYTILLDSNASEHAARIIAMQVATENADKLIYELKLEYNKSRQQAITTELLDIIGGQVR